MKHARSAIDKKPIQIKSRSPNKKFDFRKVPMPEFCYVAMDSRGKETKGKLDVANQAEAIELLK